MVAVTRNVGVSSGEAWTQASGTQEGDPRAKAQAQALATKAQEVDASRQDVSPANAVTDPPNTSLRSPSLKSAHDAKKIHQANPTQQQFEAKIRSKLSADPGPGPVTAKVKGDDPARLQVLEGILTAGRQNPGLVDQLGVEGKGAFERLSAATDHDPATNPTAAADWATVQAASQDLLRPGGAWANDPNLRGGVEQLTGALSTTPPPEASLQEVLGYAKSAPPEVIDQLGSEGATALRRLAEGQKLDFNDKQTATDWTTVVRGATAAVEGGAWKDSHGAKRLVSGVKRQVIDGLSQRAQNQPPYRSPALESAYAKYDKLGENLGARTKKMVDDDRAHGMDPELIAKRVGFVVNAVQGGAGTTPEEKQLLFRYFMLEDRDSPKSQAMLELSANAKDPHALQRIVSDVDFPAVLAPPLTIGAPGGDLSVSNAPSIPTSNSYFTFSGDPKFAFSEAQQSEISRALDDFRVADPVAWAHIGKVVAAGGQVEIRNNHNQGSHADFLDNGRPVLQLDYTDTSNSLFKTLDGGVTQYQMSAVVWHELEHVGQLGEYELYNKDAIYKALGGDSASNALQIHFENEATARANQVYQAHGQPLRASYEQSLDIRDYGGGTAGLEKASAVLLAEPVNTSFWSHEWAAATHTPQVVWTDGNSSLVSYLPADPYAGLNGTLTIE